MYKSHTSDKKNPFLLTVTRPPAKRTSRFMFSFHIYAPFPVGGLILQTKLRSDVFFLRLELNQRKRVEVSELKCW
jgi:hypothetical protein